MSFFRTASAASADSLGKKDSSFVLDTVTVTGRRLENLRPSLRIIKSEEFRGKYQDLPAVLEQESGITVQRAGAVGEYATASIRGEPAGKVKVFLDGIPLNTAAEGAVDLSKIPLDMIERIDIYKATAPIELLEQGTGSIINLITGGRFHGFSASEEAGSFGYVKAGMMANVPAGAARHTLSVDWIHAQNNYPFVDTRFRFHDNAGRIKINNDYSSLNGFYQTSISLPKSAAVKAEAFYSRYDKGLFVPFFPDDWQKIRISGARAGGLAAFCLRPLPVLSIDFEGKARYNAEVYNAPAPVNLIMSDRSEDRTAAGEVKVGCTYFPAQSLRLNAYILSGREKYSPLVNGYSVFSATRYSVTGAVQAECSPAAAITCRLMYQNSYTLDSSAGTFEFMGFNAKGETRILHLPCGQAEIRYALSQTCSFFFDGLIDSHNPGFFDKFGKGGSYHGNPDLAPETKYQLETGLSVEFGRVENMLSLFGGITNDKIVTTLQSQGIFVPANYTGAWQAGCEWVLRLHPLESFQITNGTTYMKNVFFNMKNPQWEGKNVPLTPDFKDNLVLSLSLGHFTLSHSVTWNSPYFFDPDNLDTCSNLPLLTAAVYFSGFPMTKITFRVENYLDQHIEDYRDYPKPGRAFYVAILMDIKQESIKTKETL